MDFQTYHTHEYGEKGYKLNLFHIEVVFIIVSITCLPAPPCLGRFNLSLWKQKRHGESNLSPIPVFRPSHCPCARISNAASPRQAIIYTAIGYTLLYIATTEHITCPRRRLPLHYQLCTDSKLRSLNTQNRWPQKDFQFSHWPALPLEGTGWVGCKVTNKNPNHQGIRMIFFQKNGHLELFTGMHTA